MKVLNSGVRFFEQKNALVIKTIDEKWVNEITEALPALDEILRNPRRFVEREEVIVPIELAKKTGADAVRHLSTHSQFIDRVDERGFVVPKKIMNTYNEDSFNLYENRFIVTLINVIDSFLSRRYDALLDDMGNEFHSTLKVNSEFSDLDNDEKVEYNLTLKIHQGNSYLGGEKTDMQEVFDKIEHIRKMVSSYKQSILYQEMMGCTPVKSPIRRTNLMVKQRNYKKCYDLWNFLEKYTTPGYSVETNERKGDFDDIYIDELNTLTLFNFLAMKNRLENENNKPIDALGYRKRRSIKPKFIGKLIEDFVADEDITEKELQKFIEQTIKRAYKEKNKDNEDRIIIALTVALNNEFEKQKTKKLEEAIRAALEKFFKQGNEIA